MAIHWRRIIDYVEADYLFAKPPMTEEELVTSLEFGRLLQASSVQYITAQKVPPCGRRLPRNCSVRCQREMYMYMELKTPSTTKVVYSSRDHQS
jgi:hypothetical protein